MDSIEELRAKLRRLEEEKQRAEEQQQRAKAEKQRAEEQRQRAEEQQQRAEAETRNTTLSKYLDALHELLFKRFTVETDEKTTSKGSLTSPASRRCPPQLKP
ncbi:unnamed protein product [Parascedosporium putredinis]|uniref:Uncharacterized protein n=1 Tax=Parascedosporium putredinis TaxID=1442378 RepID=A0A9P1MAT6_9PEZI|nr:unnamed protein product [Parascedosporium putredinis]CAI7993371.1 unnamed protein product [Parascedosporium putredinis]